MKNKFKILLTNYFKSINLRKFYLIPQLSLKIVFHKYFYNLSQKKLTYTKKENLVCALKFMEGVAPSFPCGSTSKETNWEDQI